MTTSFRLLFEAIRQNMPTAARKSWKTTEKMSKALRAAEPDSVVDPRPLPASALSWLGVGEFDFEVMHEERYQENLIALARPLMEDIGQKKVTAVLVPVDDDPYDKEAVRVDVDGLTVGYLDYDHAPSFRRKLLQVGLHGLATECDALIVGGVLKYDGSRTQYGMLLDIDTAFDFWLQKPTAEENESQFVLEPRGICMQALSPIN